MQMTEKEALQFAFDWPVLRFLHPRCNLCDKPVPRKLTLAHMNIHHPGWLDTWNQALRDV